MPNGPGDGVRAGANRSIFGRLPALAPYRALARTLSWPLFSRQEIAVEETESSPDRLVVGYLREIRVAAWNRGLPRARTDQLVKEVGSEIESALETAGVRDDATVYGVLDRIGPPSAFVTQLADAPRSGIRGLVDRVLAPFARLGYTHGWGLAEIGSLVLLIVGPILLWWIGPIFGIILLRVGTGRWSAQAKHRATNFVVVVFAVQALIAIGLLLYVLAAGGPFAVEIRKVITSFAPGMAGLSPLSPFLGAGPLSPLQLLLAAPPFIAGVVSGIYLAFSPRQRR